MKYISESVIKRLIHFTGNCCLSCHEDNDEWNDPMCWIDLGKNRSCECCCTVVNAYDKWLNRKFKF